MSHKYPNETLIYHGYIGCMSMYPTIPYRPYLYIQFSAAYDIYLEIIHCVDKPCFYKLQDEPTLEFDWLVSIDGNNSLKHWDSAIYGTTAHIDSRKARSDYWIGPTTVDQFKGEVKARETHKKMFLVFHESGIFIAACRHRFILLACDMIRSGELAKYPLTLIDKLLTVYGKNGACAYDIGCVFSKTLRNSSLGLRASELNFQMMVGAFHGHAHNCKCQLVWHPMYIPGTGHSEGEGCEHIFSASNELARGTRHASPFHRHQTIEEHFMFWDVDKYAVLSTKQISVLTAELAIIQSELGLADTDFPRFLKEEHDYLEGLKQPPEKDRLSIWADWDLACQAADNSLTAITAGNLEQINTALTQARIWVDSSYAKLQHAEALVVHEYNHFKEEVSLSKYHSVLDDLEHLVVSRLFELSKLSLSGTGYKLCQQIGKALQRQSEAIRNAINHYNVQAIALNPPQQKISWKDIADYSFLGEFDLLHNSRTDIRNSDWATLSYTIYPTPAHREATTKYFKLCRAHEEITQLNVKVRRLRTAIHDEELHASAVIQDLLVLDPQLGNELQCQWRLHMAINAVHSFRLDRIEKLPGFSGIRDIIDDVHDIIVSDIDLDAVEREENDLLMQDMADYLQSIND
ncbi:hypothetical protein F4604DRAFT_1879732 [Suillus subluteus]|nr:hypothetical protein F4604DRAFT_1879732 [Suillus subluteus]